MAKILIIYDPETGEPIGHSYCLPGEDEEAELKLAADTYKVNGHVAFLIDHDKPKIFHHGDVVEHVTKHRYK